MLLVAYLRLGGELPTQAAAGVALWVGIGLFLSFAFDLGAGVRNMIRADVVCLLALYYLTLFEFHFSQPEFDRIVSTPTTIVGLRLILLAFAGLVIGRHLVPPVRGRLPQVRLDDMPTRLLLRIFYLSAFFGYLHMLVAVDFNPMRIWDAALGPRFAAPWGRGKLGDWKALFYEVGMIVQILPPLAAVLYHRRRQLLPGHKLVIFLLLAWTLFQAFASGTRNYFISLVASFLGAYMLTAPAIKWRTFAVVAALAAVVTYQATHYMLAFRNIGLRNYLQKQQVVVDGGEAERAIFVDYNLFVIAKLTEVFPEKHPYLGWEIPWWCLIKPIPRAIWRGKPEGLTLSIEDALGVRGLTLSTTYIGEAYMAFGWFGVLTFSLLFGAGCAWWNRWGAYVHSNYSLLIFASGFLAAAISMRSMLWLTTAALPTVALIVARRVFQPPRRRMPNPRP
jgi:hypothetical protein